MFHQPITDFKSQSALTPIKPFKPLSRHTDKGVPPILLLLLAACGGGGGGSNSGGLGAGPSSVLSVSGPYYIPDPDIDYNRNSEINGTSDDEWFYQDFGEATINAGNGNNNIYSATRIINAGSGDDLILGGDSQTEQIHAGDGRNTVFLLGSIDPVDIKTGNGDDQILIAENKGDREGQITVDSGAGNDFLDIFFRGDMTITTGEGFDLLIFEPDSAGAIVTITDFDVDDDDLLIFSNDIYAEQYGDNVRVRLTDQEQINTIIIENVELDDTGLIETISGTDSDETIEGTSNNDSIIGANGDDIINGGNGIDRIRGDAGDDTIRGDEGNDSLFGGDDNDILYGGDGNDFMWGGDGHDELYGENHNDILSGGDGSDELFGGDGNDELRGEEDSDFLSGGEGNDRLLGGTGIDHLFGGEGADIFFFNLENFETPQDSKLNRDIMYDYDFTLGEDLIRLRGIDRDEAELAITISVDHAQIEIAYYDNLVLIIEGSVEGFGFSHILFDA